MPLSIEEIRNLLDIADLDEEEDGAIDFTSDTEIIDPNAISFIPQRETRKAILDDGTEVAQPDTRELSEIEDLDEFLSVVESGLTPVEKKPFETPDHLKGTGELIADFVVDSPAVRLIRSLPDIIPINVGVVAGSLDFGALVFSGPAAIQEFMRQTIFENVPEDEALEKARAIIEDGISFSQLSQDYLPKFLSTPSSPEGIKANDALMDGFHALFKETGDYMQSLIPEGVLSPTVDALFRTWVATLTEGAVALITHRLHGPAEKSIKKIYNKGIETVKEIKETGHFTEAQAKKAKTEMLDEIDKLLEERDTKVFDETTRVEEGSGVIDVEPRVKRTKAEQTAFERNELERLKELSGDDLIVEMERIRKAEQLEKEIESNRRFADDVAGKREIQEASAKSRIEKDLSKILERLDKEENIQAILDQRKIEKAASDKLLEFKKKEREGKFISKKEIERSLDPTVTSEARKGIKTKKHRELEVELEKSLKEMSTKTFEDFTKLQKEITNNLIRNAAKNVGDKDFSKDIRRELKGETLIQKFNRKLKEADFSEADLDILINELETSPKQIEGTVLKDLLLLETTKAKKERIAKETQRIKKIAQQKKASAREERQREINKKLEKKLEAQHIEEQRIKKRDRLIDRLIKDKNKTPEEKFDELFREENFTDKEVNDLYNDLKDQMHNRKAINPRIRKKNKLLIERMKDELLESTAGERIFIEKGRQGSTFDVISSPSTFPKWFKNLPDFLKIGKKDALVLLNKVEKGMPLTEKQRLTFNDIIESKRLEDFELLRDFREGKRRERTEVIRENSDGSTTLGFGFGGIPFLSKSTLAKFKVNPFRIVGDKLRSFMKATDIDSPIYQVAHRAVESFRVQKNAGVLFANDVMKTIEKLVPDKHKREELASIIDRGLSRKNLTEKELAVVERTEAMLGEYRKRLENEGVLDHFEENYLPHILKVITGKKKKSTERRSLEEIRETKEKTINIARKKKKDGLGFSLEELKTELGYKVEGDIMNIVGQYIIQAELALANKRFANFLTSHRLPPTEFQIKNKKQGDPLLVSGQYLKDLGITNHKATDYLEINHLDTLNWSQGTKGKEFDGTMYIHKDAWATIDNVLQRAQSENVFLNSYQRLRGGVKRFVMLNPLVHGWNVESQMIMALGKDWFTERLAVGLSKAASKATGGAIKEFKSSIGRMTEKQVKEIQTEMVRNGVELEGLYSVAGRIKNDRYVPAMPTSKKSIAQMIKKPVETIRDSIDHVLWDKWVKSGQLIMYKVLKDRFMTDSALRVNVSNRLSKRFKFFEKIGREKMTEAEAGKAAAMMVNDLTGTVPITWFTRSQRTALNASLFARNWNVGLARSITGSLGTHATSKYLPKPLRFEGVSNKEMLNMGREYRATIMRGIIGAYVTQNVLQAMFLSAFGDPDVPIHSTHDNEAGHGMDIDTGMLDSKGNSVYIRNWFFRAMHDYAKVTDGRPLDFITPKIEPIAKMAASIILGTTGYGPPLFKDGMNVFDKIEVIGEKIYKDLTPFQQYLGREDQVRNYLEILIPFTGTHTVTGRAGVFSTDPAIRNPIHEYNEEWLPRYKFLSQGVRQDINRALRDDDWELAFDLVMNNPELATIDTLSFQVEKLVNPLKILRSKTFIDYFFSLSPEKRDAMFRTEVRETAYRFTDPVPLKPPDKKKAIPLLRRMQNEEVGVNLI